jgi:threonine/homoserine/homoserine lactone efflux protein
MDVSGLWLFVLAALVLCVTPGPAVLYIVARSVSQGRSAGIASVLAIAAGTMVHVLAAAFGLSALVAQSALAFSIVKGAGALYLLWLGYRKLTQPPTPLPEGDVTRRSLGSLVRGGLVVSIFNPKTALFFLAFLPQFVVPSRGDVAWQFATLGTVFVLIGLCTDTVWSLIASGAGAWLRRHPRYESSERYVVGSAYLGLGVAAAVSGHGTK